MTGHGRGSEVVKVAVYDRSTRTRDPDGYTVGRTELNIVAMAIVAMYRFSHEFDQLLRFEEFGT